MAVRHRFRVEEVLARLELLDGEVYEMAPPSSQHAGLLDRLLHALAPKAQIRTEAWDREKKLPLCAEAGGPGVRPLTREALQLHRKPEGRAYGEGFSVARGERATPLYHPPL